MVRSKTDESPFFVKFEMTIPFVSLLSFDNLGLQIKNDWYKGRRTMTVNARKKNDI